MARENAKLFWLTFDSYYLNKNSNQTLPLFWGPGQPERCRTDARALEKLYNKVIVMNVNREKHIEEASYLTPLLIAKVI